MTTTTGRLVACAECDALQREVALPPRGIAACHRCGAELYRHAPASLDQALAFAAAAAIALVIALAHPVMSLDAHGIVTVATLTDMAWRLHDSGMTSVALLTWATIIGFPVVHIAALLYILVPTHLGTVPPGVHLSFRLTRWAQNWAMVEVYLLGCLVSLVRLTDVASVIPGIGIYATGAYVLLVAAAIAAFEPRDFWARLEALGEPLPAVQEAAR